MAVTVTHCDGREDTDVRYPPFCTGTAPSVRSVRGAQNGIFYRIAVFWRMRGEVQQPGTVAPGHEGMGAVCGTAPPRPGRLHADPYTRTEHDFAYQSGRRASSGVLPTDGTSHSAIAQASRFHAYRAVAPRYGKPMTGRTTTVSPRNCSPTERTR